MKLENILKDLRKENKYTQEDIAKKIGITKSAYGYYEQGKTVPDAHTLSKLASIFGVSTDYLLGRTDLKHNLSKDEIEKDEEVEELARILLQLDEKEQKKIMNYIDITLSEIQSNQKE